MQITVSADEPMILRDARPGALFLVHVADLADGIFALLQAGNYTAPKEHHDVVCIGSRVGVLDRNYIPAGTAYSVHLDSAITLLEQVEPAAFRGRSIPVCPTGDLAQPEPISRL